MLFRSLIIAARKSDRTTPLLENLEAEGARKNQISLMCAGIPLPSALHITAPTDIAESLQLRRVWLLSRSERITPLSKYWVSGY